MRFATTLLAFWLVVFLSLPAQASSTYVIGPGDELYVDFPLRGTPGDLQPLGGNGLTLVIVGDSVFFRYTAVVAPDGHITLPLMDPLRVSGLTVEDVRQKITQGLKTFSLRDAVSVILARPNSSAFVVMGQVQKPGRYIYDRPLTLVDALAVAGGTTDYAQLKRVTLFRAGQAPRTINLTDKELRQNGPPAINVLPLDSILVPRRWFTPDTTMLLVVLSCITTGATVYAASRY